MVDRGRIGRSCGVVWLFGGGCVYVGVLGKGLVVVNLWTRVRRQFDIRCPRWYWYAYGCLQNLVACGLLVVDACTRAFWGRTW